MRECGDCQLCCQGLLIGSARGSFFGNMTPCKYLENECVIYEERPETCRRFYCAWAQELFPEWMQPNKIGVIVSVENKGNIQYLNVISSKEVDSIVLDEINKFTNTNNTFFKVTKVIPIGTRQ
jgi:hypothetical protein